MRLLFAGDIHLDDRTPSMRIDDYCLSVIKKIDWMLQWSRENNIDKVVLLGDLFHRKEVGGRARNLCLRTFIKHCNTPGAPEILYTVGNHDTGNDLNNLKSTAIWTLKLGKYIKICEYDPESKVAFAHHHVHIDKELAETGLNHEEALIWAVHGSIYTSKNKYSVDFRTMPIEGPAQLIVCGHIHSFYKQKREDGRMLINPGNIGRNAFLAQIKTQPVQFMVVEHDGESIQNISYVPIAAAEPYENVFNLEKIKIQSHLKNKVKALVNEIETDELESFSINAVINLAKEKELNDEVVELLNKFLGEANEKSG